MSTDHPIPGRPARRAAAVRELGQLARQLAALDMAADRASARGDADCLADAAEEMLLLHVRFAECYRRLLAIGIREPRPAGTVTPLPSAPGGQS